MRKKIKKIFELNEKMLKDLNSRILDLNDELIELITENASLRLRIQNLEDKLDNIENKYSIHLTQPIEFKMSMKEN